MNDTMLNDLATPLSLLETRRSAKPRELTGPSPSTADLERILTIATRTPDHGKLSPWRFVTIADEHRDDFAQLLRRALTVENPGATAAHYEKADQFAHYQGALVVLVCAAVPDHKIPVWEQQLSCGAAGMNLLLAAHALGYVAGWVTGWQAYSRIVQDSLCGPGERIAGFIFIGRPTHDLEDRPRPPLESIWRPWLPPQAIGEP